MNPIKLLSKNISCLYKSHQGHLCAVVKFNHFQLFNIEETYNINPKVLDQQYNNLQNTSLPTFGNTFLKLYINNAYRTIKNDYDRCVYMLQLNNIEITKKDQIIKQKDFETIMDIHEKVDETTELMALKEDVRDRIEEYKSDFNEAYKNKDFIKAKEKCILLSYYMNIDYNIYQKINDN